MHDALAQERLDRVEVRVVEAQEHLVLEPRLLHVGREVPEVADAVEPLDFAALLLVLTLKQARDQTQVVGLVLVVVHELDGVAHADHGAVVQHRTVQLFTLPARRRGLAHPRCPRAAAVHFLRRTTRKYGDGRMTCHQRPFSTEFVPLTVHVFRTL